MPLVRPFRGLLYADTRPEVIARVLAPPFDMIGQGEEQRLLAASEYNIAWLTIARWGTDPGYKGVKQRLTTWRSRSILTRDPGPAFYVYEQFRGRVKSPEEPAARPYRLRGFLAAVRLDNPRSSAVYPHENTFDVPLQDRLELIRATKCNLEPVFGIYTDETGRIEGVLEEATAQPPIWEVNLERGAVHRLWRITDSRLQEAFAQLLAPRPVVIADGHHRFAGALAYRNELRAKGLRDPEVPHDYVLMLLTDTETGGLNVGAFHRVIKRLPEGIDPARCPELLGDHFKVEEFATEDLSDEAAVGVVLARLAERGRSGRVFACRCKSRTFIVEISNLKSLLPETSPPIEPEIQAFDVALLHRLILKPRLGCVGQYGAQARNVLFEHNPLSAWRSVSSGEAAMAWFVNPADIHAVVRAALTGHKVPQKATYFYPKPPSGMVIYEVG